MATYGAPVVSDPIKTQIDGKDYHTITSTKVTQGSDGKVNGGESTILYSPKPGNFLFGIPGTGAGDYIPAATTKDGGKTWNYIKYKQGDYIPSGKKVGDEIFGNQAKKSLEGGALKTNTNKQIALTATKASIPPEQQKPLTLNQNTANPTVDPKPPDATAGNATAEQFETIEKATKGYVGRQAKDYPQSLKYPENMNDNQDCIQFAVMEYQASKLGLDSNVNTGLRTTKRTTLTTITLPMPGRGISDRNSVDWNKSEITNLDKALGDIAIKSILGGPTAGTDAAKKNLEAVTAGNTDLLRAIVAAKVTEGAVGTSNLLSRIYGVEMNPNMELLFNGPTLRDFSFSFRMNPRSPAEAKIVRSIIRTFKQAMSVKRSNSVLLLKSPHTFMIKYMTSNKEHPYLNRFKECALTNCSVEYAPDGQYMSYDSSDIDERSMTAYELSLSFNELEPIFDDDYENMENAKGSFNHIGY
jgi:hypothetical protein